jgi:hypothetical protein
MYMRVCARVHACVYVCARARAALNDRTTKKPGHWISGPWNWVRQASRTGLMKGQYFEFLSGFPLSCAMRSDDWLVEYLTTLFNWLHWFIAYTCHTVLQITGLLRTINYQRYEKKRYATFHVTIPTSWEIKEQDKNPSIAAVGLRLQPGIFKIQITESGAHSTQQLLFGFPEDPSDTLSNIETTQLFFYLHILAVQFPIVHNGKIKWFIC